MSKFESQPKEESYEEKFERLKPTIDTCLEALADGKGRDRLSDVGWPLYNIVRNKLGDTKNSKGIVPQDVWEIYEKQMKESGTQGY
jgi:hypothetical protein